MPFSATLHPPSDILLPMQSLADDGGQFSSMLEGQRRDVCCGHDGDQSQDGTVMETLLCILPNLHRKYSAVENRFRKDPPLQRRRGRNQAKRIEKTSENPATEYTQDTK